MKRILNEGWLSVPANIIFRISLNNGVSVELPVIGDHWTLSWPNGYVISKTDDKWYTCVMQRPCSFNVVLNKQQGIIKRYLIKIYWRIYASIAIENVMIR